MFMPRRDTFFRLLCYCTLLVQPVCIPKGKCTRKGIRSDPAGQYIISVDSHLSNIHATISTLSSSSSTITSSKYIYNSATNGEEYEDLEIIPGQVQTVSWIEIFVKEHYN